MHRTFNRRWLQQRFFERFPRHGDVTAQRLAYQYRFTTRSDSIPAVNRERARLEIIAEMGNQESMGQGWHQQYHVPLWATGPVLAEALFFTARLKSPMRFGANFKKRVYNSAKWILCAMHLQQLNPLCNVAQLRLSDCTGFRVIGLSGRRVKFVCFVSVKSALEMAPNG